MSWATLLVLTGTYLLLYLPDSNTLIVHFAPSRFYNISPWWVSGQTENGSASRLASFDDEVGVAEDAEDGNDADEAEDKLNEKIVKIKIFDNIVPVGWSDYRRKLTSIPTFFQMEFPFCFVYFFAVFSLNLRKLSSSAFLVFVGKTHDQVLADGWVVQRSALVIVDRRYVKTVLAPFIGHKVHLHVSPILH